MKPAARFANALGLPVLAMLVAGGWYLSRSSMTLHVLEGGLSSSDLGTIFTVSALASMAGMVFAGVAALAVTPWVTAVVGASIAALGVLLLGVGPVSLAVASVGLAAFGRGMVTPSMYGALARALDGPRGGLRDAAFVALYALVNLGAMISGLGNATDAFYDQPRLPILMGLAAIALGALGLAVVAGVSFLGRDPDADKPPVRGAHLGAVAAVILLVALPLALSFQSFSLVASLDVEPEARSTLFTINPLTVFVTGLLVAAVLGVLHLVKIRVPTLLPIGLGLVLGGGALLGLLTATGADDPSRALVMGALVVGAVGEVLAAPLAASRIAADLPYRAGTLAVALFLALVQLPDLLLRPFVDDPDALSRGLAWGGVGLGLLVGLLLAAAAFPTRRVFELPRPEDADRPAEF